MPKSEAHPRFRSDRAKPGTIEEIVACSVALGAEGTGGPLSVAEMQQIAWSAGISVEEQLVESLRVRIVAGEDPLGEALNALRSPADRNARGAICTPRDIVEAMIAWVMRQDVRTIVDPGCGSGRFAAEAVRRSTRRVSIIAVDSDPVATLVCRASLSSLNQDQCVVINGDYLTSELPNGDGTVGYVGNPPYVRHHGLPSHYKDWGRQAARKLGVPWSGLAGLHVLFLLSTALRMHAREVACFITSAEWLDVGYGQILRKMLTHQPRLRAIHLLDPRAAAFSDAMTTSVILCIQNGASNSEIAVRLLRGTAEFNNLDEVGHHISRDQLSGSPRWTPFFKAQASQTDGSSTLVSLGSFVRVSRGIATGANSYFVMSKEEVIARGLADFARPALTSAEEIFQASGVVRVQQCTKYVLDVPESLGDAARAHPALGRFLAEGEKKGITDRYLCRHRRYWWVLSPRIPPMVATYMARRPPAFALNPDGSAILNVCHGLYPLVPLSQSQLRGLVAYLNALGPRLVGAGRTYHGGLEKFEPREMEAIRVPPPHQLRVIS